LAGRLFSCCPDCEQSLLRAGLHNRCGNSIASHTIGQEENARRNEGLENLHGEWSVIRGASFVSWTLPINRTYSEDRLTVAVCAPQLELCANGCLAALHELIALHRTVRRRLGNVFLPLELLLRTFIVL
jgi:hypothetical protein